MTGTYTELIEGSERLSGLTDVDEVIKDLSRLLRKLVKTRWIAVYFFDRERRDFAPARSTGLPASFLPVFREMPLAPDKIPLLKSMLRKRQHLMLTDPGSSDLLTPKLRKLLRNLCVLAVPMVVRTQVIGAVFMARTRDNPPFSDAETAIIRDLVSHAALVVSHMQLFDESLDMALDLAGRIDVILTIDEINKAISSSLSRERIMETAMAQVERITGCEFVAILQAENGGLKVMSSHASGLEIPAALRPGAPLSLAGCTAWTAFRTGRSASIADLADTRKPGTVSRTLLAAGIRSLLAIPLMSRDQVKGVLLLGDTEPDKFARGETFTIEKIASQMAVALENARLYEDMRSLFFNTVSSLANAIDAKSPWTKGHSERVMHISTRIAKEMGLSEQEVEQIRLGGLLHDIGKIGVIEALLEKPALLSEDEFPPMRLHPEKGVAILAPIAQLKEVLPVILYHHERLDGSGYPEGLTGDHIPLGARIVAVADSFDAMVSERPYKHANTLTEALEELRAGAGSQFDPVVVECFARYVKRVMGKGGGNTPGVLWEAA
ncbi:GAF domain-containing protein [Geobacter sulfurreducens]|jgi:HD-GYP domain-containing protein (c-di-GMP phosphodiesterase class II)|uniref:Sensor cyclic diguanylate phosphodiesterase, GAF and GAF domain-containing n=2 Tax=Geobacter sulfurreducens TaxID=35554 RepID=Q74EF5_GEOSL|nr:HD domain-containing phosphohydrolase [Geobacter sulfurreducens]AAR34334.1 sensor cyclic diguanylate phosphodiesterase, GAF and GAF domain-containing [Geobacter sulfurreducens PCA]ADI83850.1 sensor cyclic diguanylate phosphodiesterase, GAF and GAF domain-containing [Geobacter sulfurreducens KN400]AJY70738.1 metal-dependent phosphohydrolase [Geobacter sulfurreducens]QVW36249.1 GAF domain-containing protein [Geobacter sulfurreducens]UAC05059.1 GAF domain-containing protein [Geobacter sulfurre